MVASAPMPHQHLAVAGDDRDALLRLRQREAEPDHRRAAHGAPQIEIARIVAGGGEIPGGRAEPRHDQQIVAAAFDQRGHGGAAVELSLIWSTPSCRSIAATASPRRCARRRTPAARARSATPSTSSGLRHALALPPRTTCSTGSTIEPIGTCQGLNSSHSPRMVIEHQQRKAAGARQRQHVDAIADPLDCISSAARSPPSQAPAASATPSSSVVSATSRMSASARQRSISRACPASGT